MQQTLRIVARLALTLLSLGLPGLTLSQTLRVTLLGTGVPTPSAERYQAATLIEAGDKRLLIDAGRGVAVRLWQVGIPLGSIDGVFLTHFHSDHINGLGDLWATGWLPSGYGQRHGPLAIWGPEGVASMMAGIEQTYAPDVAIRAGDQHLPREAARFAVTEFAAGGVIYEKDQLRVTAFAVDHGALIKPAYGYRVDYAGRSVLVSGDTRYDERLIEAGKGVDLLIHEVLSTDERVFERAPGLLSVKEHHTTPAEAGRIFEAVRPKLAVYTHVVMLSVPGIPEPPMSELVQKTRATYQGPLLVGEDLMRFEIGDSIAVFRGP
jgi:ribonuclease Z